jgi:phospholipase/carboxylesterase
MDAFLEAELARTGLAAERVALVGFSQGTMMALHVGLRRPAQLGGIVGYSGLLAGAEHLAAEITTKPPVLLVHGDADQVIPPMATMAAQATLGEAGVPVEWHIRPGLAHGIDNFGLDAGAAFLSRVLAA